MWGSQSRAMHLSVKTSKLKRVSTVCGLHKLSLWGHIPWKELEHDSQSMTQSTTHKTCAQQLQPRRHHHRCAPLRRAAGCGQYALRRRQLAKRRQHPSAHTSYGYGWRRDAANGRCASPPSPPPSRARCLSVRFSLFSVSRRPRTHAYKQAWTAWTAWTAWAAWAWAT